ncbi:hypothetical protein SUGI_0999760 [Cryptomeria japonica]|nr:hypothetical protein SUGI_0999760 [Cryptomeria japonica]
MIQRKGNGPTDKKRLSNQSNLLQDPSIWVAALRKWSRTGTNPLRNGGGCNKLCVQTLIPIAPINSRRPRDVIDRRGRSMSRRRRV